MALDTDTPIFQEKKVKDGWVLELVKQNELILSTSLFNPAGKLVENRSFLTQKDSEVDKLREYVTLFDENPEKNFRKMMKLPA